MLRKYHIIIIITVILSVFAYFYNEYRLSNLYFKRGNILYNVLNNRDTNASKKLLSKYIEKDKKFILASLYYLKNYNNTPYNKDNLLDNTLSYENITIREIMLYHLYLNNILSNSYISKTIPYSNKLLIIFEKINNKKILDKNFLNDLDLDLNKPKQYDLYAHKLHNISY